MISDQIVFERNIEQWRKDIGAPLVISFPESDYAFSPTHSSSMSSIHSLSPSSPSQSPEPNESYISLSTILEEKNRGKQLMEFYKRNNCFQQQQRDLLINLIATYFDENNIHLSLCSSQKLEEEITHMFPSEKTEFYRMGKRGKIYFKYFNLRRHSRKLKPAKRKLISPQKKTNKSFHPETDAETCLNSLKYDNLSVEEFDSLWASCSQFRLNDIFNSTKQTEIFEKWPFYKKPNGYRLIDKDFQTLYPTSTSILSLWQDHWKTLKNFLMENIKDKKVTESLKDLGDTNFGEDDFVLEILKSIHFYLFPTAAVSRKSNTGAKSRSKFTIKDSLMAFIFEGETTQVLEDHITFLKSRGETIQPLILALREKNEYFILLDDYKLKTTNVLRAVDICFKCFFLFNLKYPPACENFWDFIELYFYMKTNTNKTKKMNPKLSTMLHTLST
ncbi:uncharacterized protein LOC129941396 [Eupeodes corollae]|uniref:uncharacterized protein LOC129941396 n=1 Tax=Eupeodes corollae TaxID=290404 RepID=UPI0024939FD8|nr:uncharacterized protein LOC129941396 [Eupeodes corollae]